MVVELLEAWHHGFVIQFIIYSLCIKIALTCVACDIPATRKVCGFLSHNTELGCNKKFESTSNRSHDYSGYDIVDSDLRSQDQHRRHILKVVSEVTKTTQKRPSLSTDYVTLSY